MSMTSSAAVGAPGRSAPRPKVNIIVLTWNQCAVTLECLGSLREQHYPNIEITLVDNGSADGSVATIKASFPGITIIENGENLGFAEGNNVGLRRALAGDAEYIMLLNNDTIVAPGMIGALVDVMEGDLAIGITGPKMLYFDQPGTIWCAGNRVDPQTGESIRLRAEQADDDRDTSLLDVDFITACAICLRREVIEAVGLLDPRFFIYYEETDWCARARANNWRVAYVPQARLWHKVSATMGTTSPATDYYMTRNRLLYLAKNGRGIARFFSLARATIGNARTIAAYTLKAAYRERRRNRDARLYALRDAMLGRWGEMGGDVTALCYGKGR
jgi:GT2 family glycosyltransferase